MILDPTSSYYNYLFSKLDLQDVFYNPMGINSISLKAKETLIKARRSIANFIGCKDSEIIFTSNATESNNTIIKGANAYNNRKTILTTQLEHISILHPINTLSKDGFGVLYLPMNNTGDFIYEDIPEDMGFVSLGAVCRDSAQKRDIDRICKILREKNQDVFIHIDAWGLFYIDFDISLVDAITIDATFLGAISGISAFYIKKGKKLKPLIEGGIQERGLRAGDQNIFGIKTFKNTLDYLIQNKTSISEFLYLASRYIQENIALKPLFKNNALGLLSYEIPQDSSEKLITLMEKENFYLNTSNPCMGTNTKRAGLSKELLNISGEPLVFRLPPIYDFDFVAFTNILNKISKQL